MINKFGLNQIRPLVGGYIPELAAEMSLTLASSRLHRQLLSDLIVVVVVAPVGKPSRHGLRHQH